MFKISHKRQGIVKGTKKRKIGQVNSKSSVTIKGFLKKTKNKTKQKPFVFLFFKPLRIFVQNDNVHVKTAITRNL